MAAFCTSVSSSGSKVTKLWTGVSVGSNATPFSAISTAVRSSNASPSSTSSQLQCSIVSTPGLGRGGCSGTQRVRSDRQPGPAGLGHGRLDLARRILGQLRVGAWRHPPAGSHDLQAVDAVLDLLAGDPPDVAPRVGLHPEEVAMAAGDRDRRTAVTILGPVAIPLRSHL